ncbi:hypothetical protein WJX73_000825 [Symbiochloris irregularis]|uniref:Uncharacterized protein n=1 Tax=Symbiochloris irregularis TaxID=706552 RepID=A0AAW1NVR6_9CHLO
MTEASASTPDHGVVSVATASAHQANDPLSKSILDQLQALPKVEAVLRQGLTDPVWSDLQLATHQQGALQKHAQETVADLQGFQEWYEQQTSRVISTQAELISLIDELDRQAASLLTRLHKSNLLMTAAAKQLHNAHGLADLPLLQERVQQCTKQLAEFQGTAGQ